MELSEAQAPAKSRVQSEVISVSVTGYLKHPTGSEPEVTKIEQDFQFPAPVGMHVDQIMLIVFEAVSKTGGLTVKPKLGDEYFFYPNDLFSKISAVKKNVVGVTLG